MARTRYRKQEDPEMNDQFSDRLLDSMIARASIYRKLQYSLHDDGIGDDEEPCAQFDDKRIAKILQNVGIEKSRGGTRKTELADHKRLLYDTTIDMAGD